jgi:NAD(P)-dependent dehydrogenase (short-subunit alcohol dehydrogenase family)
METALITGANRGIGLELARQLKDRGYHIIAVCRESSPALNALDVQVESGIDITRRKDLEALADRLRGHRIELLVNNAGLMRPSSLGGIEDELDDWRAQYEVNALAPLRVTHALSNHLVDGGKIVIITSRMGSIADNTSGGHYAYRMSKAAVNIAGVSLAHEFRDRGIAVGLLHPGFVRTDMTGGQGQVDPREAAAGLVSRIDELGMRNTGSFHHANGEALPW